MQSVDFLPVFRYIRLVPSRSGPVHVATTTVRRGNKTYHSHLLRKGCVAAVIKELQNTRS